MDGLSWRFLLVLGGAVAALVGVFVGLAKVVDWVFVDYRKAVTSWEPVGFSDDGRTITVRYATSKCPYDPFDHVERSETDSGVTLSVITRYRSRGHCEDVAVHHETDVRLDRPLGDRRLIDGRIGAAPDPRVPTTVPIRVRQVVDVSRGSYPHGFQSFLRLRDPADGGRIRDLRLPEPTRPTREAYVSTLALRLRPDEYRFEVVQRPCEWGCEKLAPSTDGCSIVVEARPLEPVELTVRVRPNHGCALAPS